MATLDWELTHRNGITLVELSVTTDSDEQVRIESNLEPVWPPRRQGVPVAGWDDTGFEGSVAPDRPLVVGYASPAAPEEPPAKLVSPREDERETTAREVVRSLGDASPPRDVVSFDLSQSGTVESMLDEEAADNPATDDCRESSRAVGDTDDPVNEFFADVADRIERAERLSGVSEVDEAREVVAEVGGLGNVRTLAAKLERDRRIVAQCRQRTTTLQERLDGVEVPLATLERVT